MNGDFAPGKMSPPVNPVDYSNRDRYHSPGFLHFAGFRYWTASLLPALAGTTLPFWLQSEGFSLRWPSALEFLIATALFHSGFSFWHAGAKGQSTAEWPLRRLLGVGTLCLLSACLVGLHLNANLPLGQGVHRAIFLVYGVSTVFVGVLYVVPPLSFYRRVGSEVVLCESLGMLPLLGAYLVQVGDLNRTVYLVSLPLIVATALWVLMEEFLERSDDGLAGCRTVIVLLGPSFSGKIIVPALSVALYATIILAVASSSASPWALVTLLSLGLAWRILSVSRNEFLNPSQMVTACRSAARLHFVTGAIIAVSPMVAY